MTFQVLVETFLSANSIAIKPSMMDAPADGQTRTRFVDKAIEAQWCGYHHRSARLRVVAADANLAQSTRHRLRAKDRQLVLR